MTVACDNEKAFKKLEYKNTDLERTRPVLTSYQRLKQYDPLLLLNPTQFMYNMDTWMKRKRISYG